MTDGGFAEYVRAPARNAVPLPDAISDAEAAPIGCGVTTAVHAANLARVGLGDWVVVYGAGAVGFGLVQVARLRGARVIAVGRTPAKLDAARALGAEAVVRAGAEDVASRVRALTGGRGADVVFELVATRETMAASVARPREARPARLRRLLGGRRSRSTPSSSSSASRSSPRRREHARRAASRRSSSSRPGRVRTVVDRTLPARAVPGGPRRAARGAAPRQGRARALVAPPSTCTIREPPAANGRGP